MSGLVTQTRQKGRGSGLSQGFTFRRYTTTETIAKPYGCTLLVIEAIGSGGAGGGGGAGSVPDGGGEALEREALR